VENRKMVIAIPALVLFIFAGGLWIADRLPRRGWLAKGRYGLIAGVVTLLFVLRGFAIPHEKHYGYIEAARLITSNPALRHATVLVSSKTVGEGLFVSEMAMREPMPQDTILRATKVLAHADWVGTDYHSLFSTPAQLMNFLRQSGVGVVVLDTYPGEDIFTHHDLLRRTIAQSSAFRRLAAFQPGGPQSDGEVDVYRFNPAQGNAP